MSILHIINKADLGSSKHFISFNDGVIFWQNVIPAIDNFTLNTNKLYILRDDFAKLDINAKAKNANLQVIDYAEFVQLSLDYDKTLLWN